MKNKKKRTISSKVVSSPLKRRRTGCEIKDYDEHDSLDMIDKGNALKFEDLGLELPASPPTQVISIRLPSWLLNQLKAIGSEQDVPYQALIKLLLSEGVHRTLKKAA